MKSFFFKSVLLLAPMLGFAQTYIGFSSDNYSGIHSTLHNPANVVGSPYRFDMNLLSLNGLASNDAFAVPFSKLKSRNLDFDKDVKKMLTTNNNAILNIEILGPSFMFNLAPKHAIGIFTKQRSLINIVGIDGTMNELMIKDTNLDQDFRVKEDSFNLVANTWAEVGLTYGAILLSNQKHSLKAGVSLKYLAGFANSYSNGRKLDFFYDSNVKPIPNIVNASGNFVYGSTLDLDNLDNLEASDILKNPSYGYGVDLGLSYEFKKEDSKPTYLPNYHFKVGLSVTDIGSLDYTNNAGKQYNFTNAVITENTLDNTSGMDNILKLFDPNPKNLTRLKSNLPTAFHANVDWNFYKKFYFNFNTDLNVLDRSETNQQSIANTLSVTPRYETKWFSFYIPVNYMDYRGLNVGAGLRLGYFFIGSGSILSNVTSKAVQGIDVYGGLKIPFFKKEKKYKNDKPIVHKETLVEPVVKDTDGDGLLDNVDQCPTVAGPTSNNGCPYQDTDQDGVVDPDDKCPTVSGPVENLGCPWPDTDGDGVLDKDDKCVNIIGTIKNNGCPEVTEAVVKKLNQYAKVILFESGKNTFKQQTYPVLEAMYAILNEYPSAKFSIEGHTDGDGPAPKNLTLSETRATAVMAYLVEKGIDVSRLSAKGYGESKPIASNKTKAGKALNRRVEVKLIQQ